MNEFDDLWGRLQACIDDQGAGDPRWRPGVSDAELDAAEATLGLELPADYRAFLKCADGQDDGFELSVLSAGGRLAPLEQVIEQYDDLRDWHETLDEPVYDDHERVLAVVFHAQRLDIGGSLYFDGDNTVLDFAPGPRGTSGQVLAQVTECEFVVVGESLLDYLRRVVVGLETGVLVLDRESKGVDLAEKENPWDRCEKAIRSIEPAILRPSEDA